MFDDSAPFTNVETEAQIGSGLAQCHSARKVWGSIQAPVHIRVGTPLLLLHSHARPLSPDRRRVTHRALALDASWYGSEGFGGLTRSIPSLSPQRPRDERD